MSICHFLSFLFVELEDVSGEQAPTHTKYCNANPSGVIALLWDFYNNYLSLCVWMSQFL